MVLGLFLLTDIHKLPNRKQQLCQSLFVRIVRVCGLFLCFVGAFLGFFSEFIVFVLFLVSFWCAVLCAGFK